MKTNKACSGKEGTTKQKRRKKGFMDRKENVVVCVCGQLAVQTDDGMYVF